MKIKVQVRMLRVQKEQGTQEKSKISDTYTQMKRSTMPLKNTIWFDWFCIYKFINHEYIRDDKTELFYYY